MLRIPLTELSVVIFINGFHIGSGSFCRGRFGLATHTRIVVLETTVVTGFTFSKTFVSMTR